jgi:hypothetical protein
LSIVFWYVLLLAVAIDQDFFSGDWMISSYYEILAMMLRGVWEISFLLSACRTMHIVLNVWLFYLCTVIFILGTAVFIEAYFLFPDCATAYSFQTQLTQSIFCFFLIYLELSFTIQVWTSLLSLKFMSWWDYLDSI